MATLIAFNEVQDGDHWVRAWHGVPDMDRFQSFMAIDDVARPDR